MTQVTPAEQAGNVSTGLSASSEGERGSRSVRSRTPVEKERRGFDRSANTTFSDKLSSNSTSPRSASPPEGELSGVPRNTSPGGVVENFGSDNKPARHRKASNSATSLTQIDRARPRNGQHLALHGNRRRSSTMQDLEDNFEKQKESSGKRSRPKRSRENHRRTMSTGDAENLRLDQRQRAADAANELRLAMMGQYLDAETSLNYSFGNPTYSAMSERHSRYSQMDYSGKPKTPKSRPMLPPPNEGLRQATSPTSPMSYQNPTSAAGNPLIPDLGKEPSRADHHILPRPTGDLKDASRSIRHMKSSSFSKSVGVGPARYGALRDIDETEEFFSRPKDPRPVGAIGISDAKFSPRTEIMAFAKPLSSSHRRIQMSPQRSQAWAASNQISPHAFSDRSPRSDMGTIDSGGRPHFSKASSLRSVRHPSPTTSSAHVNFSPLTPVLTDGNQIYNFPLAQSYDGSERNNFLPRGFSSGSHSSVRSPGHSPFNRSTGSTRKMFMRQRSVELFMGDIKGTEQPTRCRDLFFALLFCAHLGAFIFFGCIYGSKAITHVSIGDISTGVLGDESEIVVKDSVLNALNSTSFSPDAASEEVEFYVTYSNVITLACICGTFAVSASMLALVCMTIFAKHLIQVGLCMVIGLSFAWGTIGVGLSPKNFVPVTGIIALAFSVGYTFVVWDRIPFASANLKTGLTAIKANWGVVVIAFCFQALALAWTAFYAFGVIGIYDAFQNGEVATAKAWKIITYIGLAVSYYWTYQVIMHIVQATVAGAVGAWWFKPEVGSSCCPKILRASFLRSSVFSFGSICLGSLFVGFVQLLRQIAENFRPNKDRTVLMCLHECLICFQECIVSIVDRMAHEFNPWAFTYIGLYGYNFVEAGGNATDLFQKRGWSNIVSDDLISNVLFMVCLVIGGITGCFGFLVERVDRFRLTSFNEPQVTSFLLGAGVGLVLSSILLSMISSSVNAVIVCFAGSPVEFEENHKELSREMRTSWREVWPGCMDAVDIKLAAASVDPYGGSTQFSPLIPV